LRDDGLQAQLAGQHSLVALPQFHGERFSLLSVIDVAHPDPVFARARRHEITLALRFLLGGGSADGIPFAFAALRPFRADTWSSHAPGAGRLGRAGPVD